MWCLGCRRLIHRALLRHRLRLFDRCRLWTGFLHSSLRRTGCGLWFWDDLLLGITPRKLLLQPLTGAIFCVFCIGSFAQAAGDAALTTPGLGAHDAAQGVDVTQLGSYLHPSGTFALFLGCRHEHHGASLSHRRF